MLLERVFRNGRLFIWSNGLFKSTCLLAGIDGGQNKRATDMPTINHQHPSQRGHFRNRDLFRNGEIQRPLKCVISGMKGSRSPMEVAESLGWPSSQVTGHEYQQKLVNVNLCQTTVSVSRRHFGGRTHIAIQLDDISLLARSPTSLLNPMSCIVANPLHSFLIFSFKSDINLTNGNRVELKR